MLYDEGEGVDGGEISQKFSLSLICAKHSNAKLYMITREWKVGA